MRLIAEGALDLGVGTTVAIMRRLQSGTPAAAKVRVVIETPPYVNLLWAAAPTLPVAVRIRIRDAFLALTLEKPEHRAILQSLEASAFMPAFVEDYAVLAELMRRVDLFDRPLEAQ